MFAEVLVLFRDFGKLSQQLGALLVPFLSQHLLVALLGPAAQTIVSHRREAEFP